MAWIFERPDCLSLSHRGGRLDSGKVVRKSCALAPAGGGGGGARWAVGGGGGGQGSRMKLAGDDPEHVISTAAARVDTRRVYRSSSPSSWQARWRSSSPWAISPCSPELAGAS